MARIRHPTGPPAKVTMDPEAYWEDAALTEGLKTRSVRGASITAIAQLPKVVLLLASQLVLARLLVPADFGLVAMVTPVTGFVAILADLGLTQAIVSRPRLRLAELNAFFWINLVLSVALAVVVSALVGPLLAWLYGEPRVIGITAACAVLIVVSGAGMLPGALLNRQMRYGALAMIEVVSLALSVVLGVAVAWYGGGYWSLIAAQAGASLTVTWLGWALSHWRPRLPGFDRGALSLVRFGGNITVSNLAGYLNITLDNVMIGGVLGKVALGLYDRAWKLAVQPLSQIQAPFHRVAVPTLSRLVDDPPRYRRAFVQMTQAMLLAIVPAMIVAGLLATPLIGLLLGARWLPAAPVFAWLCVGAAVTPINSAAFWLFVSQDRSREQMTFGTIAAAINVAAYAAGLHWGIAGVAASSAVSVYLLQTPILIWAVIRTGPIDGRVMRRLLLPNIVAAAVSLGVLWTYDVHLPVTGIGGLAIAAILTLACYAACLACFRSSRAELPELAMLPAMLRRRRGTGDVPSM